MGRMKKAFRRIGGRTYYLSGLAEPRTKAAAKKEKRHLKSRKLRARIIKCKGGYRVFGG